MKKFLFFDSEKCSACGACALACMDQNDIDIPAGEQPFRNTFTLDRCITFLFGKLYAL